ncbi:MAG: c-type cytochrome [Alphaproteobacteria bacterium]|jgi:mono/diheme cytochrome c family protein|nr:c-type cytochrome [Alphaproteobacteria bacterium]MBT7943252.1 c-type cytochrome [Alphaproteobacteria bacterium]
MFRGGLQTALIALLVGAVPTVTFAQGDVGRGKYLFDAAGCAGCHTDKKGKGALLAGGRPLKTPFGVFYSPNITPDPNSGIGKWSDADFIRAMRHGIAPDGDHYFPVFPYPSYSGMSKDDLLDIKAYLLTTPPKATTNRPHEVAPPFGWRFLLPVWKALYFAPGPFQPTAERSPTWNRGAYLVRAVLHCGECHSPRNPMGGLQTGMEMAGTSQGPTGGIVPNITPDRKTGIGRWSKGELEDFLDSGMLPDGDFAGSEMGEVIDQSTGRLTTADRRAIVAYIRSIAPVENHIAAKKKK